MDHDPPVSLASPQKRRRFLVGLSAIAAALSAVAAGAAPVVAFLSPVLRKPTEKGWTKVVDDVNTIAVGVPALLVLMLVGLPFFDRNSMRHLRGRPVAMVSLTVLLGGSALLVGAAVREMQPTVAPETGRLLTSMERVGRATFQRQCASCHVVDGKGGDEGPELSAIGSRHSTGWLHSYIENPVLFHPESEMSAFGPPTLSHQEIEEVARYLGTLRGPRGHEVEMAIFDTFPDFTQPAPRSDTIRAPISSSSRPPTPAPTPH